MDIGQEHQIKRSKSNGEDDSDPQPMDVVVGIPIEEEQKPDILKLDVDCFEELFDWLSLVDLHAMSQTCKRLRQIAGYFFWNTYKNADVECKNGGIFINNIQINGFCEFIRSISVVDDDLQCFHFIKSNDFVSLEQITLHAIPLTTEKIACIKHILNKAEFIELFNCTTGGEFYGEFLQYCSNMKHLMLRIFAFPNPMTRQIIIQFNHPVFESQPIIGTDNSWLLHEYPKLEYFGLLRSDFCNKLECNELSIFFERNRNVRKFATHEDLCQMDWLNHTNLVLDDLAIYNGIFEYRHSFKQLKKHFKRLQLYVINATHSQLDDFIWDKPLEKFHLQSFSSHHGVLLRLENLKELCIPAVPGDLNIEVVSSTLNNLERVSNAKATFKEIEAFIVHAPKLNTLTIHAIKQIDDDITIDLVNWNQNRGHLARARKITIFVDESVYLAVKWKTYEINYNLLELKRIESCEWTHDFGFRS